VAVLTACALAAALVAGVPWPIVAIMGLGSLAPWPAAAVVTCAAGHALRSRRGRAGAADEAALLGAVAAEMRGGASLRTALATAASAVPGLDLAPVVRLAEAGAPVEEMAGEIAGLLPGRGRSAAAALSVAGVAGGRAAVVFERLAADAWAEVESGRTHAALTAQARLSAWVVGGLPIVAVAALAATGRLGLVVASGPAGIAVMALGLALELAGIAAVVLMLRGVGR
jgi:tight adherence protein B